MNCLQCGAFAISGTALATINRFDSFERSILSAWIRENPAKMFTTRELQLVEEARRPSTKVRAEKMLRFIASVAAPGEQFASHEHSARISTSQTLQHAKAANPLLAVGWCANEVEMQFLIDRVLHAELGYLELADPKDQYRDIVSPKGWMALEAKPQAESSIGFCAMWFDDEVRPLFDQAISPAIRESGYEVLRIDQKEHTNKIDDEIVASIRSAKFVVADYTGERGGVYYEAGFAHGLGLPVIFLARDGTAIHFDTRQYNTIFWKNDELEEAKNRLRNRILATNGRGPLKTE